MYSAWRSEVRQWVWCEAVWVAVACEMHGLASTGVWPDGREVAVRTLRSPDIFSQLTESSKSWIQPVPNMLCMPVPPNTLRIRLSRTLSEASPTVQGRPTRTWPTKRGGTRTATAAPPYPPVAYTCFALSARRPSTFSSWLRGCNQRDGWYSIGMFELTERERSANVTTVVNTELHLSKY